MTGLTCQQALDAARALSLDRLDAQLLLLHALNRPASERAWLVAHDADALSDTVVAHFQQCTARRAAGEPLAYIVGHQEFFGLQLQVDARVLVPRPDTETLVEWALEVLDAKDSPKSAALPWQVLDLGTGSGAVALAIGHSLQQKHIPATITALDVSPDAMAVVAVNAQQLGVSLQLLESHWLDKVSGYFHLIVSNPPYIAAQDPHLAALKHEPLQALAAGSDGLDDIRKIINDAPGHLLPGGWLLLEHGYDQSEKVCGLLAARGFRQVQSRPDLAGIARCSGGQLEITG